AADPRHELPRLPADADPLECPPDAREHRGEAARAGRRPPRRRPRTHRRHDTKPGEEVVLVRILRDYLRPYRGLLVVLVLLQLAGTIASLYLPSLNGRIIDDGVAKG